MLIITNSFKVFAFAPGMFNIGTPGEVNYETGILLTPTPARSTTLTLSGKSIMRIK